MKKEYISPALQAEQAALKEVFALSTSDSPADPSKPSLAKEEEEEEEAAIIQLLKDIDEGKTSNLW
ncbi:MAG: hypothetical protein IJ607_09585 [Bacteroidaceae bacterium]|nr:hypothetical protein [Bacteroidaceae bacterium]